MPRTPQELEYRINKMGFHARVEENPYSDGERVLVSAEHGDDAADYWAEPDPYINPKLKALAKRVGGYWEWVNAGELTLVV